MKVYMSRYIFLCLTLLLGCTESTINERKTGTNRPIKNTSSISHRRVSQKNERIKVDSTINKRLELRRNKSIETFYPNYHNLKYNDVKGHPFAFFTNKNETQYLMAYKFEGDVLNVFSSFEIGFLKDHTLDNVNRLNTRHNRFESESGIRLNMTLKELIAIKGNNYIIKKGNRDTMIIYKASANTSDFVKRYNMDTFSMEYTIRNNIIKKIFFGFDYP